MKDFRDYGINAPASSGQWYSTCPECSHQRKQANKKKKCLSVKLSEGKWNCHNCGWHGHLEFTDEEKKEWAKKQKKLEPVPRKFRGVELRPLTQGVYDWFLKKRKIEKQALDALQVSWNNVFIPSKEKKENAIAFPYYQDHEMVKVSYRTADKEFTQEKGGKKILYNYDNLTNAVTVYLAEGEIDVLTLYQCGYKASCSVGPAPPLKTKNFDGALEAVKDATSIFEKAKRIYICMDKDEPGIKWEEVILEHIGKEKCYQVLYPSDCKDMNDVLVKYGKEKVQQCINEAKPYPIAGVKGFEDIKDEIFDYIEGKTEQVQTTSTGWVEFDQIAKLPKFGVTLVTGSPSAGKSTFVNNLIINTIAEWNWLVFSPEHKHVKHWDKLTRILLGNAFNNSISKYQAEASIETFKDRIKHITIDEKQLTLKDILIKAKAFHYRFGLNALVIDPFNFIKFNNSRDMKDNINEYLIMCKHFAGTYNVNVITVAHPTKLERLAEKTMTDENQEICNYRVAQPYDISGSKDFYAIADVIYSVWRNLKPGKTDFVKAYVLKCRDEEVGQEGVLNFTLDRNTGKLHPKAFDDYQNFPPATKYRNYYDD